MTGTEVERQESTRSGRMDLAAAKLANSVGSLMGRAARASGKLSSQIAKDMQVTPGRVTQILGSGGNVRIATLARFMDACGYELKLTAEPKEPGLPRLELPTRGRRPSTKKRSSAGSQCSHMDIFFLAEPVMPSVVMYGGEFDNLRPVAASADGWAGKLLAQAHWLSPTPGDYNFEQLPTTPTDALYEQGLPR